MPAHHTTPYQSQYVAWLLSRQIGRDSPDLLASTLVDARVGLNPHQVEAALFAFRSPLSQEVILSAEQLDVLAEEVGPERSLLVCCGTYRGVIAAQAAQRWPQLTIKKIPTMVKDRCEWGHDDYSLNGANLPMAAPKPGAPAQDDLLGEDGA
ncbi:type III DNA modification methylase [Acidovorax sp. FJL06]|nr:type III DNA modification methylase [Acidovorax sp. FJL06]